MTRVVRFLAPLAIACTAATVARADEVTDWNQIFLQADIVAGTNALYAVREAAIVQASVFDAVNGIERKYSPIHVWPAGPREGSIRAATVEAAYTALVHLFPTQKSTFDAALAKSLNAIAKTDDAQAIRCGLEWGRRAADAIWEWRSKDGFYTTLPPYKGGSEPGEWRPTPPAFAPGLGVQFATMTPWAIKKPWQFRPGGPPPLSSIRHAADFNEAKTLGSITSAARTPEQTLYAKFWASAGVAYLWNRVAISLANERKYTLSDNARLLAMMNVAMADSLIACWDAKYTYSFWRLVTEIPLADADRNPDIEPDPAWGPLIVTPPHPEYPSAHSTASSTATTVLAVFFGENTAFTVDSFAMPGVVRTFSDFSAATAEIKNARIVGGIHYRSACNDGVSLGTTVAEYVLDHAIQRRCHREHGGDVSEQ